MLKSYFSEDTKFEAGCDEAGRGCLAGPVVAGAVILPKDFDHKILTDSKALNKKTRDSLVSEIKEASISWAVAIVEPEEIDKINILKASFLAMHRAVDQLKTTPDLLLIDGNRFTPYPSISHECIVKGDSKYFSIAAASILAKTYRDNLMEEYAQEHPYYGWEKNYGYPTRQHRDGIREYGITPLHRKSFQLLPRQLDLFKEK
ncbi:ribonuclease HII [Marinigracilibium pacificum]|uniref:Ribonuclease HII n=1 Tax=Marinigracilibium pacificum TaxID=2729599 RepID=A0A848J2R9_9BACT|nr:ribonuclease HII [Marinigracilibium pacificum]